MPFFCFYIASLPLHHQFWTGLHLWDQLKHTTHFMWHHYRSLGENVVQNGIYLRISYSCWYIVLHPFESIISCTLICWFITWHLTHLHRIWWRKTQTTIIAMDINWWKTKPQNGQKHRKVSQLELKCSKMGWKWNEKHSFEVETWKLAFLDLNWFPCNKSESFFLIEWVAVLQFCSEIESYICGLMCRWSPSMSAMGCVDCV